MLLSEAIRLGSMLYPQAFGETFKDGRTCAMGAALAAIGAPMEFYGTVVDHFPVTTQHGMNPVTGETCLVISIIRQLNDLSRWTRPQIADWVATIEPSETPSAEVTPSTNAVDPADGLVAVGSAR